MDDKDTGGKYDRQIRLWSSNGQQRLSLAHVALIGVSVTGTEILKNLVLPGIGKVTVIDSSLVDQLDIAGNFFLDPTDLGKPKAKAVSRGLSLLNPDVEFIPICYPVKDITTWQDFSCVINTTEDDSMVDLLWDLKIPLLKTFTIGFYSFLRVQINEKFVVETHDNDLSDLRIDQPWPELQKYIDSIDDTTHSPYNITITKLYQKFQNENNGQRPKPADIRKMISPLDEEIYKRASVVLKDSSRIPYNLTKIFEMVVNDTLSDKDLIWSAAKALHDFYTQFGVLPLSGVIPDMESQTDEYIRVKELFNEKFERDKQLLTDLMKKYTDDYDASFISIFAKNCKFMICIKGTNMKTNKITKQLLLSKPDGLPIYLSFQLVEEFFKQNLRFPSSSDKDKIQILKTLKLSYLNDSVPIEDGTICDDVINEMLRANGKELHNISAIMGGIAAQEVIKIVTNHYIPLDNCCVFDGVKGEAYTIKI